MDSILPCISGNMVFLNTKKQNSAIFIPFLYPTIEYFQN